ncbi:UDP-glycosyltransferase UGT5-like [Leguminivora glycinivorella]|uniref:UDP-glycosyltransferase UGT5-like n=1 Tax=Leguminivora glycinivorella TaxID=1035111 RepID=UPI00200CA172|nr:UDP-glycosyltransferase UGT5-like [Leguminivora glycinivorella]
MLREFIVFLCLTNLIESARILGVFPIPSISHQVVFRPLMTELAKRGHDVVVITTDPAFKNETAPANLTEIDVHDVSYKAWKEKIDFITGAPPYTMLTTALQMMVDVLKVEIETPQVKEFMAKDQKFDLVIAEACVPAALGFAHKYKAPVIQMSSFYGSRINYDSMGAPSHMFLYPELYRQKLRDLSILDKVLEVVIELVLKFAYANYVDDVNRTLKKYFGEDTPNLSELEDKIDMLFVNSNPIWEGNRPVPSSVVYLGGLHMKPVKELPKDLKSYLDTSKGVIYVSFGTNFNPSTLAEDKIRLLLNVFSKLPYDVLCKWDAEDVPGRPSNVRIVKWVPQNDLLRHPSIKLFITQGGMQSTDEAIAAGVPLIGIPILVDQFFNTEKYIQHKIGEKLVMEKLSEEEFYNTIMKVLGDDSYRQNILKLRKLMADQPMTALERAVWWTEHVLRHGGARHLRAPAANMGWVEYLELPLVATLLVILITTLLIPLGIWNLLIKLIKKLFKSKPKKD